MVGGSFAYVCDCWPVYRDLTLIGEPRASWAAHAIPATGAYVGARMPRTAVGGGYSGSGRQSSCVPSDVDQTELRA